MMTRDEKGRFPKGVSGNPKGRAPKQREVRYREILISTVTFEDWKEIINKAVSQAKKGDCVARKWLSDYLIGPPIERKELTGADGGPVVVKTIKGVSVDEL